MEGCDFIVPPYSACHEHFLTQHTDLNIDIVSLLSYVYLCSEELFQTGLKLSIFCEIFLLVLSLCLLRGLVQTIFAENNVILTLCFTPLPLPNVTCLPRAHRRCPVSSLETSRVLPPPNVFTKIVWTRPLNPFLGHYYETLNFEGEAQFGPRSQDKTSIKAPLAQYLLSSYIAVTHPLVVYRRSSLVFVGLNRPAHTVACTQAVLDPSVPEDQQRQEERQPFFLH